jgi:transcriptional regulator PpsR
VTSFKSPKDHLGNLSAETAATVIEAAADVALIVDSKGVIEDVAIGRIDLAPELAGVARWAGRRFSAIVSEESQPKVEKLLSEAASGAPSQWRQLGHADAQGGEVPVLYCAVQIHKNGRMLVLGRDMRALATLQQRLVEAQMSMERDYSRLRHAETRYRVLFQTSSEPALVLDAATDRVVEANPAAARLFGETSGRMIGRNFPAGLDADSAQALQSLSTAIRAGLNVEATRVRFTDGEEMTVATSMFRQGASAFYMLRFTPANLGSAMSREAPANAQLVEFSRRATDGILIIGGDGRIQSANSAFLQMTQIMTEDQARGELIERWLGRTGVDMNVMIANLRQHGSVTLFATILRGNFGATSEVEISGVSLGGDPQSFGLAIRNVDHRIGEAAQAPRQLPQSVEQLKELIGRVSLKDMVRDTTDMIEKMCIQAALELTGDNRASAAEMLGLSRQSLYVKLRRYGMAEETADAESE